MSSSPLKGDSQSPQRGRKGPETAPHQSPSKGHPYLPLHRPGKPAHGQPGDARIELTASDDLTAFHVWVFARSGRGDEMVRPMVWQGTSYEQGILAGERYARATGLPVVDLVLP